MNRDPSQVAVSDWTQDDMDCLCVACGQRFGAHSGTRNVCPFQVGTFYVHAEPEPQSTAAAVFHLTTLLELHKAHHNEPAHAAARAFLRSLECN